MKCISAAVLKSSAKKGIRESEGECRSVMSDSLDPMDYTVHGSLQARILEWVAFSLPQGIFPTQGLNPGLPHCRRILYQLSHKEAQESWSG